MKRIITTLIILLGVLAVRAENIVSVTSASGHPQDEVTLNLSLTNTDAAVAFQAEIPLGSQLTYVEGTVALNADRITDHQVNAAVVEGNLRIYVFSLSLTPFVGEEGDLLSFSLQLKNEPGDYAIDVSSTMLSDAMGTALAVTTTNGTVTILSPKLQINTPNMDYGHVPIRSEYTQNANVTNVGNEPLVITGITFSDEVFCCPSFTETTLQAGESANFTFKFSPMVKGAVTATATIVSNSIAGNGLISLIADPFAVNEIHISNTTGYCDSIVEVPVSMNNMDEIMGFQIDMNLPEALEYVDFNLSGRKTDHVCTGVFSEGLLRLMAYSVTGSTFTGNDGEIGILRLRLKGLYGDYYLNPSKALLADTNGEDALSDQYQGRVTIRSPKINGNDVLSFGSSPVTEVVTKEYEVRNNGNAPMRIDQVVFDQPGFAVAESFPITVNEYSNAVLHVSYSRELSGDFNALMKIYSNDPENGLKNVTISGHRYEPNSLSLTTETVASEAVSLSVGMINYSGIVAMQADFCYPHQAFSLASSDFQLTERFNDHILYALPSNDSVFRILVLSLQNTEVDGNMGEIVNITLHPTGSLMEEYTATLSNIVLSGVDGVNVFTGEDVSSTITLLYHFITDGNWSDASNWSGGELPDADDEVFIEANCQLDQNATVASLTVTNGKTLTLQSSKILTVTNTLINTDATGLVIKDGAQLLNASANVSATVEKDILAYVDENGWYTIASPMNGMVADGSDFLTPVFDLYRYNETSFGEEWENYKAGMADFTTFENGCGYLYANNSTFSPTFIGTLNNATVTCPLTYTDRPYDDLDGFNLIGNPFPHVIYKGNGGAIDNDNLASGYYTLTNEGIWHVHTFMDAIQPGQGIMVKTTAAMNLDIVKSNAVADFELDGSKAMMPYIDFKITGDGCCDRAVVYFSEGISLDKMQQLSENTPMLYIHQGERNYAIAHFDQEAGMTDLMFKNTQAGTYTLSVSIGNTQCSYLHLIDQITKTDIDLLKQQNYTFQAIGNEPDTRFMLVFKIKMDVDE